MALPVKCKRLHCRHTPAAGLRHCDEELCEKNVLRESVLALFALFSARFFLSTLSAFNETSITRRNEARDKIKNLPTAPPWDE